MTADYTSFRPCLPRSSRQGRRWRLNLNFIFIVIIWDFMNLIKKIIIIFGLALITSYLLGASPKYNLQNDFDYYNEQYFYGALPNNTKVIWSDLSRYNDMARMDKRPDGSVLISIDPRLNPDLREADMSLLHEMCHEKLELRINVPAGYTAIESSLDPHGPAHEQCMIDLAERHAFHDLW